MAVTSDRNLTAAPWPRTWSGLRALAVLVDPDRRHGRDHSRRTWALKGHRRDVLGGKGLSPPEMARWNGFNTQAFYAIDIELCPGGTTA